MTNKSDVITADGWHQCEDGVGVYVSQNRHGVFVGIHDGETTTWYSDGICTFVADKPDIIRRLPENEVPSGQVDGRPVCKICDGEEIFLNKSGIRAACECVYETMFSDAPTSPASNGDARKSISQLCADFHNQPKLEASNGKLYPAIWFAVQQRFSDVTPPEGVELIVLHNNGRLAGKGRLSDLKLAVDIGPEARIKTSIVNMKMMGRAWTLAPSAPSPSTEKQEEWADYVTETPDGLEAFEGEALEDFRIWKRDVIAHPKETDALIAWLQNARANLPETGE